MSRKFGHYTLEREGDKLFGAADPSLASGYKEHDEADSPREAREKSPFQKGDVFYIRENGQVKLVRLHTMFGEYLSRRGYWIPRWRVQFATKELTWSRQWRDTWPGFHYRAHFDDKGKALDPAAEFAETHKKALDERKVREAIATLGAA